MRTLAPVLVLALVLFSGCVYEVPVTADHTIPIDPAVLGLWQEASDAAVANKEPNLDEQLLALKYSDTEYLIRYPSGKNAMYFRGYPVKVGDSVYVQVQLLGANGQPVKDSDRKYHVVAYQLADGVLELKTLNTDLVPGTLTSSAELVKAIQANLANPELFKDPGKFRKVAKE